MGNWKIRSSLSLLSLFKKARPLFAAIYPRAGVGTANQGTAANNLALRQSHRLDVGKSENVGARGNWSVAKRGSKSFQKYQSRRGAHGKIGLGIFRRRYSKRYLPEKKRQYHALSRRFASQNERF